MKPSAASLEQELSEYRELLDSEEGRLLALADLTDAAGRARIERHLQALRLTRTGLDETQPRSD